MPAFNSRQHPTLLQVETFSSSSSVGRGELTAKPAVKIITKKCRVRFQEIVYVRPIRHVDTISQDEKRDVWFCKHDFVQIKKDLAHTVRMMAVGVFDGDDDEQCSRGLEYRTRAGALRRRGNKWMALNAVLDEQDCQQELQLFDEELLRKVYIEENKHCRRAALEMGLRDQEEVRWQDEDESDDEMDSSEDEMECCDIYNMTTVPSGKRTAMRRDE